MAMIRRYWLRLVCAVRGHGPVRTSGLIEEYYCGFCPDGFTIAPDEKVAKAWRNGDAEPTIAYVKASYHESVCGRCGIRRNVPAVTA